MVYILKKVGLLKFVSIFTFRRDFFERDIRDLLEALRKIKFLEIIKSLVLVAIPLEERKNDLLYSSFIYNNFYKNCDEKINSYEIKIFHKHYQCWGDGLLKQDFDSIMSVVNKTQKSIKFF